MSRRCYRSYLWRGLIAFIGCYMSCHIGKSISAQSNGELPVPSATEMNAVQVEMLWSVGTSANKNLESDSDEYLQLAARHQVIAVGPETIGLEYNHSYKGLSTGFTPESIEVAQQWVGRLRQLNPQVILLMEIYFFEYYDDWLPSDHSFWLRDEEGNRLQFWPGTHRVNFYDKVFQEHVLQQIKAVSEINFLNGVLMDNFRTEDDHLEGKNPEAAWISLLTEVRKQCRSDLLLQVNMGQVNWASEETATLVNGLWLEDGLSEDNYQEVWERYREYEQLACSPKINLIEVFGRPEEADKRHWTIAFALLRGPTCYIYADSTDGHFHQWYSEYEVDLGSPVTEAQIVSPSLWVRRFQKGWVLLNPPHSGTSSEYTFSEQMKDFWADTTSYKITLSPGEGKIMIFTGTSSNLDKVVGVYPNPYKPNSNPNHNFGIKFGHPSDVNRKLTQKATIKIYNIAGELVRTIEEPNDDGVADGETVWDAKNRDREPVSSGIYIYYITNPDSPGQKCVGKIGIIK